MAMPSKNVSSSHRFLAYRALINLFRNGKQYLHLVAKDMLELLIYTNVISQKVSIPI